MMVDNNEFPNIPMDEKDRARFPARAFLWMGHQDNGSWDHEPCPCCPSIKYIRCDEILSNTEILFFIMGYQGGSVHQCAEHLGVKTHDILTATPDAMQDLMRKAQAYRNRRDNPYEWKSTSALFDEDGKMTAPIKEYIIWDAKNKRARVGTTITIFGNIQRFTHYIDMDLLGKPKETRNDQR